VWHVKKLGVFPKDDAEPAIFKFCGLQFNAACVLEELNLINTPPFETREAAPANTENNNQVLTQRRTPTCALRLFQIMLGHNHFYERLLKDSVDVPNCEELDAGANGQNVDFWVNVHAAYIDPTRFVIGKMLVDSPLFKDNDGIIFDLSKVSSLWMDRSKLKLWYETALRALQKFRVNHDRSGKHDFLTEEGYQDFAHNYVADSKDVCFLAGAVQY
jgi:hypothetical protein